MLLQLGSVKASKQNSLDIPCVMRQHEFTFPAFLFHHFFVTEPESIDKGILVWCKWQRYPYWPAVVRAAQCSQGCDVCWGLMGNN